MNKPTKFEDLKNDCVVFLATEDECYEYKLFCKVNELTYNNAIGPSLIGCYIRFNDVSHCYDRKFYQDRNCKFFTVKEIIDLHKDYVIRKKKLGWYIINPSTIVNIVHHIADVKTEYPFIGYSLAGNTVAYKEETLNKATFVGNMPIWERVEIKNLDKIPADSKVRLIGNGFISAKIKDLKELNICVANGKFVIVDQECEFASVEYLKTS